MPKPVTESPEGGQHIEWSETVHAYIFRARIYLRRFGWIIIITMAAGVLYQAWTLRNVPPTYASNSEIQVSAIISSSNSQGMSASDPGNYFTTQVYNLNSPDLQAKATDLAKNEMPSGTSTDGLWASAQAQMTTGLQVIKLHAIGNNPDFTQKFLDALMQVFLEERKTQRDQRITDYGTSLQSAQNTYQENIKKAREDRSQFVISHNLVDLDGRIANENSKLNELSAHREELWAQLKKLLTAPKTGSAPPAAVAAPAVGSALASTGGGLPVLASTDIVAAAHLDVVPQPDEQISLKEDPKFKDYILNGNETVDHELALVGLLPEGAYPEFQADKVQQVELATRIDELKAGGLGGHHPEIISLQGDLTRLNDDLQVLRLQRVDKLEQTKRDIEVELRSIVDPDIEDWSRKLLADQVDKKTLDALDDEIQVNQNAIESEKNRQASLTEVSQVDQEIFYVRVHASPASIEPLETSRKVIEGAVVGFAAGAVIVILLGVLDGRVMSVEDLSQRFDEPILGVIPMQKRQNGQVELLKSNDQRQMFAESCRNIRSSLLYMDRQGQRPRVIMLTSSTPSEGKSTISANLAITLGFATSRTLLVDADMRRGQLHKRFGLRNEPGLAEHIRDGLPLDQVIQHTASENLDFIPSGRYPEQPGELLMSERFRESIQTMRQRYDFVLFDSPPIIGLDDAASFATRPDAVIFVVRAGYTRMRQVRTSLEHLNRRGVDVYGIVVNFIDHREPGYYSYRYYDYYSYKPGRTQ